MSTGDLHGIPHLLHHITGQVAGLRAKQHDRASTAWEAPLPFNVDAYDDAAALWTALVAAFRAATTHLGRSYPVRDTLPTGTSPAAARAEAGKITTWLARHQAALDGIDELEQLLHTAHTLTAKYPTTDRTTTSKTAVCPDDRSALTITPPRHAGDDRLITCTTCGRTFTENEHDDAGIRFAAVRAHEARAARVTAHLMAKYGPAA